MMFSLQFKKCCQKNLPGPDFHFYFMKNWFQMSLYWCRLWNQIKCRICYSGIWTYFLFSKMLKTYISFYPRRDLLSFSTDIMLVKKFVDLYLENSWKHVVNSVTDVFLRSPPPPPRLSKEQKLARGVIVVNKAKQRKIRKASSSSSSKSTLDDSGQNKFNFKKYIFLFLFSLQEI